MRRLTFAVVGVGCLSPAGCGTFSDALCGPADGRTYYRGVRLDIEAAKEGGPMALMAADIPLSAVADTLLIPYYARRGPLGPPPAAGQPTAGGQPATPMQADSRTD